MTLVEEEIRAEFRNGLRSDLANSIAIITFTKRDGSSRVMKCTLAPEHLPARDSLVEDEERLPNPETLVVWDLEVGAWRSFRLDSIKRIVMGTL
jgi:hypothetical protein